MLHGLPQQPRGVLPRERARLALLLRVWLCAADIIDATLAFFVGGLSQTASTSSSKVGTLCPDGVACSSLQACML